MINKKDLKFYRVDNFRGTQPFLVPSQLTLAELIVKVQNENTYDEFEIFLHSQLLEQSQKLMQLEEIVKYIHRNKDIPPVFYILELHPPEKDSEDMGEYYESIVELLKVEGETKTEWRGANGHMLFEGRDNSLIASSYTQCARMRKSKSKYSISAEDILSQEEAIQPSVSDEIKQVRQLVALLKQKNTKEELVEHKTKQQAHKIFSDYDINFVIALEKTYLTYMLRSGCRLSYIEYKEWSFGVIDRKLTKNDKIGIIGDYGTGLDDSYELLENMVLGCGVNVILHLGDVYYAGTPEQYQDHVACFIKKLRVVSKKELLFYSIPGNHDYYSWGMPFLCFVKEINEDEFTRQKASYFCLRTQDDQWQFLGADTAFHDSNPFDQINKTNAGPRLRKSELAWHRDKLENFSGSTILLTHHQLFSIHDRICGSLSSYRHFSCVNPVLSKQLFEYMPYLSAWYWGHQHAFMLFKEDFWGVPRCRLLGNSSFHVIYQKEHPYHRKSSFPEIPFILPDQIYLKKYLPLNPNLNHTELYFNLCFAVIDLQKAGKNLLADYYCSPSYNRSNKKQCHFPYYKLHEQIIENRHSIFNKAEPIATNKQYYLKNQTGLLLNSCPNAKFELSFYGTPITITTLQQSSIHVEDEMQLYLQVGAQFLSFGKASLTLSQHPSQQSVWTFKKVNVMHDSSSILTHMSTFSIRNQQEMKFLSFLQQNGRPIIRLGKKPAYWQCLRDVDVITN